MALPRHSLAPVDPCPNLAHVRIVLMTLAVAAGFYAVVLAFLYFSQARLVYYPDAHVHANPGNLGLPFEEVEMSSGDARLHGWFVPGDSGRPVVLFCHGNAGNIADRLEALQDIHESGLSALIFDYAGYGKSTGLLGEEQTYSDAAAAYAWLLNRGFEPADIVIYGRSLGAAVAAHVAQHKLVRAIVLETPFTSLADVAAVHYAWAPTSLLLRIRYDAREYLQNAKAPITIIHSPDDRIIPFSLGQALYESAPEPKRFLQTSGGHNAFTPIDWDLILERRQSGS